MLHALKSLVRNSSLQSVAQRIRARIVTPTQSEGTTRTIQYDWETVEVMKSVLREDSTCLDVGAHEGAILRSMVEVAPGGRHFAFEPLPHLAEHLRRTFPGVQVCEAAVSDHSGTAQFLYVENDPAYSGLQARVYDRADPVIKPISVKLVSLDEVVPQDLSVAFIKIDIEGGEFHAIAGAAGIIQRCRPVIVFEAGEKSSGQYGVAPEAFFELITERFGYHLSTMHRWLASLAPYTVDEFSRNWQKGPDYYFIACPPEMKDRSSKAIERITAMAP